MAFGEQEIKFRDNMPGMYLTDPKAAFNRHLKLPEQTQTLIAEVKLRQALERSEIKISDRTLGEKIGATSYLRDIPACMSPAKGSSILTDTLSCGRNLLRDTMEQVRPKDLAAQPQPQPPQQEMYMRPVQPQTPGMGLT